MAAPEARTDAAEDKVPDMMTSTSEASDQHLACNPEVRLMDPPLPSTCIRPGLLTLNLPPCAE